MPMSRDVARRCHLHRGALVPGPEPLAERLIGRHHIDTNLLLRYPIR
jgi:hypothetical protein